MICCLDQKFAAKWLNTRTRYGRQVFTPDTLGLIWNINFTHSFVRVDETLTNFCVTLAFPRGFRSAGRWCPGCLHCLTWKNSIPGVCPKMVPWHHHFTHGDPITHNLFILSLLFYLICIHGGYGYHFHILWGLSPPRTDSLTCLKLCCKRTRHPNQLWKSCLKSLSSWPYIYWIS